MILIISWIPKNVIIYLMLDSSGMDENSEGKRQFNECMDKKEPKDCTSIKVRGNYKGFRNLKLQVVIKVSKNQH